MPRSPQQNQRIKDERRRQIMDAALSVFAEKGLAATMMSDIAAASDLSYGLIYHYFHDKEELFITLVERALQGTLRLTEDVLARPGSPWERLYDLCTEMVEGARTRPEYFRIMLQAQVSDAPSSAIHALMSQYGNTIWGNVTTLILQGQAAGQVIAGNPRELVGLLITIMQGLSLNQSVAFLEQADYPPVAMIMRLFKPEHSLPTKENSRAD
jgi:AcrR family transcriptional regulator